jgi:transcriptional regulator with XRE-family HTH domain
VFKQRRLDLGLRLKDLAQQLQTTPQCLSRYESGKRRWPPQLLQRLQAVLGLGEGLCTDWFLSWEQHLDRAGWNRWQVGVDPGPTWANTEPGYDDFYRQLQPRRSPPLAFRGLVRADSALEICVYVLLCEAGARPVLASPVALHFPHHPLLNGHGRVLGMERRAAFLLPGGWLLWPQVTLQLARRRARVDCLAARPGGGWAALEFDGPSHGEKKWDAKRDAQLEIKVLRFTQGQILGPHFAEFLEGCLVKF